MKATGIVRRIDDLGRVVIPKEIRRTMRIREGDPLEIYTDREGEVIFKKYSPIGEMAPFASQYAETLYRTCGFPVAVCDRDAVIACFGVPKKDLLDKKLSPELEKIMEQSGVYAEDTRRIYPTAEGGTAQISAAMPIRSEGGICGCIMSLDAGEERRGRGVSRDAEQKLIQTAGTFLGRQFDT